MTPRDAGPPNARRERPRTEGSYGIPESDDGLLPWRFVEESMTSARSYWVTTVRPDGRPHVRPTWGVWVDGQFHCGGGEGTRWVRNLAGNDELVVHLESTEEVVVVEGTAERVDERSATPQRVQQLDEAYQDKYDTPHGTPFFAVHPDRILAWTDFPADATRWTFRLE